jgi:hypothetical protein
VALQLYQAFGRFQGDGDIGIALTQSHTRQPDRVIRRLQLLRRGRGNRHALQRHARAGQGVSRAAALQHQIYPIESNWAVPR